MGRLVSSASAVASATTLAKHGEVSALVNLPVVWRVAQNKALTSRVVRALGLAAASGVVAMAVQAVISR